MNNGMTTEDPTKQSIRNL